MAMEVEDALTINQEYASKYEKKKRAEELSKCKYCTNNLNSHLTRLHVLSCFCTSVYITVRDKYGDVGLEESESSSSDEEEEDDNAEVWPDTALHVHGQFSMSPVT